MAELVHDRTIDLVDRDGREYTRVFVRAEPLPGGTWGAWLEFVARDGATTLRTGRETTQSTLQGVAYWTTGLQPTFFEGALRRAFERKAASAEETVPTPPRDGEGGAVGLRLLTVDPTVPFRFMAARTLVPGLRRPIHNGGAIVYRGSVPAQGDGQPTAYEFVVQFGSENAAGIMANRLWNDLHGLAATLEIDGAPVEIQNAAIKDALLAAQPAR